MATPALQLHVNVSSEDWSPILRRVCGLPPGAPPAGRGDWLQTFTGGAFFPLDPRAEEMDIYDIAHALSRQCRYAGQCDRHYSVAEHSYWLSLIVPPEDAFAALMHDAPEAYVVDVPTPVKRELKEFARIEERVWLIVCQKFGTPVTLPASVIAADQAICLSERDQNMKEPPYAWRLKECGWRIRLRFWNARKAEKMFLRRFKQLTGQHLTLLDHVSLYLNNKKLLKETVDAPHRYSRQGTVG